MLLGIFSTYFPGPVFSRPRAPIFTGTISVLRPHILEISISNSVYFESFSIILTGDVDDDDDDDDDDNDDEDDYYYVLRAPRSYQFPWEWLKGGGSRYYVVGREHFS